MNKGIISFAGVLCFGILAVNAYGQQTVFNVPSADVLDKGKAYVEFDAAFSESTPSTAFTPRLVYGVGHNIEVGANVPSFNVPDAGTVSIVPTIKWKFYEDKEKGVTLFAGDHVFLPVQNRTFDAGNYVYVEAAKSFKSGTRIGAGVYDFSAHVVDSGSRAGVQASLEQTVNKRLSFATDWFSGNNSTGFVTPGFVYKLTKAVSLYTAYEIGNDNATHGNHAVLVEIGWNPN
jgi:hypothetical protein